MSAVCHKKPAETLVLVVEDDPDNREVLALLLDDLGYRAVTAANGRQALDILREGVQPALILMDLQMPVMDGWELGRALQANPAYAGIPLYILSAAADMAALPPGFPHAGTFVKPVQLEALLQLLAQRSVNPGDPQADDAEP